MFVPMEGRLSARNLLLVDSIVNTFGFVQVLKGIGHRDRGDLRIAFLT
jgi:hypothetical protein